MMAPVTARLVVPVSDADHAAGPRTAPVTLVEYGDYECPYCGEAHPIVQQVQDEFGEQLRFVFRHFPLTTIHPHAEHAAEAAESAAEQNKFWPMHDMLFEHQDALEDEDLVQYAEDLGLDASRVEREILEQAHAPRIRRDFIGGVRSGVNGTPTFFINGVRHDGPFDFESLREAIDLALAEAVDHAPRRR